MLLIKHCLHKYIILFAILFYAFHCPSQATNGMFPTFMGIPGAGRGGVDIGIGSDPTCINTNPGGLGFLHGKAIEMSFGSFFPSVSFENAVNSSSSNFEPVPIGSMAFAWDQFHQTSEVFLDPWVYAFGGSPSSSEYIFISGGKPLSTENDKNSGTGFLDFVVPESRDGLQFYLSGASGTLQGIRIITTEKLPQTIFETNILPKLPPQAKIVSLAVHYDWKSSQDFTALLEADEITEKITHPSSNGIWQTGYLALAWDKEYFPYSLRLRHSSDTAEISVKEILLGYRLVGKTYWEKIPMTHHTPNEFGKVLAHDTRKYSLIENSPLRVDLVPFLRNVPNKSKVRLVYFYDRKAEIPNRLEVIIQNGQNTLAKNVHGIAVREATKPVPICQRNADQEMKMDSRSSGWKWGFGVFPQAGARYTINLKTDDFFQDGIENRTDMTFLSIAPALAYRFGDRFSIGVSLNFNMEMIELDGLVSQTSLLLKGTPIEGTSTTFGEYLIATRDINYIKGELDTNALWGFGVGGRVGFMWKISDRIQLGAMYSPKTWMTSAEGKVTLDFNRHFNQIDVANIVKIVLPNNGREGFSGKYDMKLDFELPQQAGVGLSWLIAKNLMIAADFRWIDYSDTQYIIQAKLSNGSNTDLNALVGGKNALAKIQVGWKDQYVTGIGMVWQSSPHWIWRMGYNYSNSPVSEEYLNPQLAAISEHHVTLGSSYVINRNITVHTAIEAALPNKLKSGSTNYVHEKYANSELDLFTVAALMGVSMRF